MSTPNFDIHEPTGDRRWAFFIFNAFLWTLGGILMAARISANGWTPAACGLFVLFLLLQAPVAYGFTLAATGWWVLRRGGDEWRINRTVPADAPVTALPRTAIVMPIFHEDVGRVFQGLRVMYESLRSTGHSAAFDFYVLSDSADSNVWMAEEKAWFELCRQVQGFGHVFYRKRRISLHHKSGNVADFCRRWGGKYEYLIVLDADSIMNGKLFLRLVQLMEAHPETGMIQTFSRPVLGQTLFQRVNQFASFVYAPLFVAGANFWQLDNATFYGHNAIIRVKPFMQFCAMPELPPSGRLGTRILSHDTVEAALIRRAGYAVWGDYDLEGSYEEGPPHLLASLVRDQRWCRGNMQHVWFLFSRGLTLPSRVNILVGMMAYASSPLWLLFLLFSPVLFIGGHGRADSAILFVSAMFLLLIPKALGVAWMLGNPAAVTAVGGRAKLVISTMAETVYSMLLAPILMLFYTRFVYASFFGASAGWGRQKRSDEEGPSWGDCAAALAAPTLLALAAGGVVEWLLPSMLPWLCLVLAGPLLAIPFCRLSASSRLGLALQRRGWFLTGEEVRPAPELQAVEEPFPLPPTSAAVAGFGEDAGLADAVLNPRLNILHVSLLRERGQIPLATHERLMTLCDQLLREGPQALPPREKKILLWDADAMLTLHQKLWASPASGLHKSWQEAFQKYVDSLEGLRPPQPIRRPHPTSPEVAFAPAGG